MAATGGTELLELLLINQELSIRKMRVNAGCSGNLCFNHTGQAWEQLPDSCDDDANFYHFCMVTMERWVANNLLKTYNNHHGILYHTTLYPGAGAWSNSSNYGMTYHGSNLWWPWRLRKQLFISYIGRSADTIQSKVVQQLH